MNNCQTFSTVNSIKSTLPRIVFIDSRVPEREQLVKGIIPNSKIVVIEPQVNGIKKITEILQTANYAQVDLISHGSPGCLYLGNTQLSLDNLQQYQSDLQTWFLPSSQTPSNTLYTLLIYGCNVAVGDAGREFITKLQQLTGSQIAASNSLTGNKSLGGNWELEVTTGDMDVNLAVSTAAQQSYAGVLATFVVTTAADEDDGDTEGGDLSLREAINAANNSQGKDTIAFDSSLSGSTITLSLGEIAIADSVKIEGLGSQQLTIDGANSSRVFNIDDGKENKFIDVALSDVTITGGNTDDIGGGILNAENLEISNSKISGNTAAVRGGGIYNDGNLQLIETIVDANTASSRSGGGISNTGTLEVVNSYINNNVSGSGGAGIANIGLTTIDGSLISGNSTTAAGSNGGGIVNVGGELVLNHTEVVDNSAVNSGGGIANEAGGTVTVVSSNVSGNTAIFAGGGIYNTYTEDSLSVKSSTIANNQAEYGGGISNSGTATITNATISGNTANISGGGLDNYEGTFEVKNSTISNNSAPNAAGIGNTYGVEFKLTSTIVAGNADNNDLGGDPFTSGGNNLIGNGDGAVGFVNEINGDLVGDTDNPIDAKLGPLQNNGGFAPTQELLSGSPAIDAGSNPDNLTLDQRGLARVVNGAIDIGAVENQTQIINGTNKKDILIGTSGDDIIKGFKGNDLLFGNQGNDLLNGNNGNDIIGGGLGDDSVRGGAGNDLLGGGEGNDLLNGDNGNDSLGGGNGNDIVKGDAGNDLLGGGDGNDLLIGGKGQDTIGGGKGDDLIRGGDGNDFIGGGKGNDTLYGGAGNDTLSGNDGIDVFALESGKGQDFLFDFADGKDLLGLTSGLSFDLLHIVNDSTGTVAIIQDTTNDNTVIAFVNNVDAADLTADDFITL